MYDVGPKGSTFTWSLQTAPYVEDAAYDHSRGFRDLSQHCFLHLNLTKYMDFLLTLMWHENDIQASYSW